MRQREVTIMICAQVEGGTGEAGEPADYRALLLCSLALADTSERGKRMMGVYFALWSTRKKLRGRHLMEVTYSSNRSRLFRY